MASRKQILVNISVINGKACTPEVVASRLIGQSNEDIEGGNLLDNTALTSYLERAWVSLRATK